ncbi:hypothetical protein HMPREF0580_1087 [Mobiluncus mulieris ATCC 35239]|uniref:Uncharacterized protein n=2 Tax=Mobiluncus mulieris TaxID=2052 RepID=E0QQC2_9ACTO|nr:hypothetical protein [Mobiluncus mulieris]EFM46225.1 hypothetical protein HMPREF0580_1087 [Mobiluncus mulieris ATCC 35239]NMW63624.1 hypothetical protein [Mobiluncus mulieris]NMW80721.1 hypothetical protein [Mobiluncus mulieris]NMW90383.1 hypothetical protein [Mobiluncus mulieris]NMW92805.1 hypothetical protein [Mobiluncus mulieris]
MVKLWVSECETATDLLASFRIRRSVFGGEQSVTFAEELSRLRGCVGLQFTAVS